MHDEQHKMCQIRFARGAFGDTYWCDQHGEMPFDELMRHMLATTLDHLRTQHGYVMSELPQRYSDARTQPN